MACPANSNSGLTQLTGNITTPILNSITEKTFPLHINFAPRTTVPHLNGRRIDEPSTNTCRYEGHKFALADVQICKSVHTGYSLPGQTITPSAELILSFSPSTPSTTLRNYAGVLLCLPIYQATVGAYDGYLNQIVQPPANSSPTALVPTLQSLFYNSKKDTNQTSINYATCFETVDTKKKLQSHSLYVVVFPNGIQLKPDVYALLLQQIGALVAYSCPPAIKGTDPTVLTYSFNTDGNKISTSTSSEGNIYTNGFSTSNTDFVNRFQYCTLPPRLPVDQSAQYGSDQCPYYKTTEYKCMPFDQLKDLNTDGTVVIPGNKSLDQVLKEQKAAKKLQEDTDNGTQSGSMTTQEIAVMVGSGAGVIVGGLIFLYLGNWLVKNLED